jgi:hypothetical protein
MCRLVRRINNTSQSSVLLAIAYCRSAELADPAHCDRQALRAIESSAVHTSRCGARFLGLQVVGIIGQTAKTRL